MEKQGKVILLGGTPRAGKTTLAARLTAHGFSKYSLDTLTDAITGGLPEVSLPGGHDQERSAEKLFAFFRILVEGAVSDAKHYGIHTVFDMYDFTPEYVRRLPFEKELEVYFLGYPRFSAEEIRFNIRHYAAPDDWIAQVSEEYLTEVALRCERINRKLTEQCARYGYELIDTGAGEERDRALGRLLDRIVGGSRVL